MSWFHKILDHDLHRSKIDGEKRIFILEVPGRKEFLPCVVSTSDKGRFIENNSITNDNRIRTGVFEGSEEALDEILPNLFTKAYEISKIRNYSNIFGNPNQCCEYLKDTSGYKNIPNICFLPSEWSNGKLKSLFKSISLEEGTLFKGCKYVLCDVKFGVFLSRPDFVGLYTRLPNNQNSIILHNIELGMSFLESNV